MADSGIFGQGRTNIFLEICDSFYYLILQEIQKPPIQYDPLFKMQRICFRITFSGFADNINEPIL